VEDWAKSVLDVSLKDSLWEVQMAMVLGNFGGFRVDVEKRCRSALELDPSNWRASHTLAKTVESLQEAITILKEVTDRLSHDEEWMQESSNKETTQASSNKKILAQMIFDLGVKYWHDGQIDTAVETYTRGVQQDASDYERNLAILEQYQDSDRWADIIALNETMEKQSTADSKYLLNMASAHADKSEYHEYILHAAIETNRFDILDSIYLPSIDLAGTESRWEDLYYFRYYYGIALNHRPDSENKAIAVLELALKEDLPRSSLSSDFFLPQLILALAPIYLRLAREAEPGSELAADYLMRISDWLQDEANERNLMYPSKLFLARYYHKNGDKVRAKETAKSVVKVALEMLSDDDVDNDSMAYWRLLMAFIPLEDDENTLAAWVSHEFAMMCIDVDGRIGNGYMGSHAREAAKEC
jgi:hypothetical protein